ncbi:MAG: hypothetical protein E7595_04600 [Ruminococcaceae bacterium]|nr:hypothetical protein [Oscillospiraceae bacterium]
MKKPIISVRCKGDVCRIVFALTLIITVGTVVLMPEDSVSVFAAGTKEGISGLISMVSKWL